MESFGVLLRRHRMAAVLTQERLAERARISATGIAAASGGIDTPTATARSSEAPPHRRGGARPWQARSQVEPARVLDLRTGRRHALGLIFHDAQ